MWYRVGQYEREVEAWDRQQNMTARARTAIDKAVADPDAMKIQSAEWLQLLHDEIRKEIDAMILEDIRAAVKKRDAAISPL